MSIVERILDRLFLFKIIRDACDQIGLPGYRPVLLKRWFVWGSDTTAPLGFRILVHKLCRSDSDRECHDHPWPFISIVLWRGYMEQIERPEPGQHPEHPTVIVRRNRPGMVLFRKATHRHRVVLRDETKPSWTLVFTRSPQRSWGFWRDGVWIHWKEFVALRCKEQT